MYTRPLAALAALLLCAPGASAEQFYSASANYDQRIADLESELASLRSQLNSQDYASAPGCSGCGDCQNSCCQSACCGGGWFGGVGFYYIKPTWETNPAFLTSTALGGGAFALNQQDFDYDHEFAPRVWLGYVGGSGLGVRGNWWGLDSDAGATATATATTALFSATPLGLGFFTTVAGDTMNIQSDLDLDVIDLEAVQTFGRNGWSGLVSGGVRWAQIRQQYRLTAVPTVGLTDALGSTHSFDGIGPTASLELRQRLWDTGFSLFGSGRAAILFGNSDQHVVQVLDGALVADATTGQFDVIPVGELEIGTMYDWDTGFGNAFVSASLVGMTFFGAGNSANVESAFTGGADNTSNLGFFGLSAAAGIRY
jgi:hypothetical protein